MTPAKIKGLNGRMITNYEGGRYGKLTVLKHAGWNHHGLVVWNCKCDCGNEVTVRSDQLKSGRKIDCGCGSEARRIAAHLKRNKAHIAKEGLEAYLKRVESQRERHRRSNERKKERRKSRKNVYAALDTFLYSHKAPDLAASP